MGAVLESELGQKWRYGSPRRNFVTPTPPTPPSVHHYYKPKSKPRFKQEQEGKKFELSLPASPHPVPPTDTNHLPPTSNPHPRSYADSVRDF